MASTAQASQDMELSNTKRHLQEPTQKLEMDHNGQTVSRQDYGQMTHENLVSLAICQDLSSRLEINSLKLMLEHETMKKESLANLLDQERSSRVLLEEQINQAARDANEMQMELGSLKAELAIMKKLERAKKARKERRERQARKLERESQSLDETLVERGENPIVEASGSQFTDQMSLQVSRSAQKLRKEERRAQLARREAAKVFENFRIQFEEFLRAKLPHLLDGFHKMVDEIMISCEVDDEGYSKF
ncbi:hypothetical protein KCV07_g1430, partial [Aureobasidium melanogenum]